MNQEYRSEETKSLSCKMIIDVFDQFHNRILISNKTYLRAKCL